MQNVSVTERVLFQIWSWKFWGKQKEEVSPRLIQEKFIHLTGGENKRDQSSETLQPRRSCLFPRATWKLAGSIIFLPWGLSSELCPGHQHAADLGRNASPAARPLRSRGSQLPFNLFATSTLALKGLYLHSTPACTPRDRFASIFATGQFRNTAAVSAAGKATAAVVTTPSSDEKQRGEIFSYAASKA